MSYDVHVTRDVMVVMRDGVRLATDVYRPAQGGILVEDSFSGHPGTHALREGQALALRDRRRPRHDDVAAGAGIVLRVKRLRGGVPGLSRPPWLGRNIREIHGRGRGRLRHVCLDPRPDLLQWQDRHDGPVLRRPHAGRARCTESAGSVGHDPELRRLLECLPGWHSPGRSLRAETGDMGLAASHREP